ncbi:alpha/beta hydrolase [Pendulispora rubella]|uniref:Alpha/beta hydrolase n=1 Tax=Pendulispora rubella TaxID=2741070 RepID=A0ABZ2KUJ7_9BACT
MYTADQVRTELRNEPHDFLDIGHSQIAHWRFGRGPDLLFVHGWPLHAATFRDFVPPLAERFTCHLIDLPHIGHTQSKQDAPTGLSEHAASLRRVVDALDLTRFAYVAHDSGAVAARIAAKDDPRVVGLALGDTEIPGHVPPILEAYRISAQMPGTNHILRLLMRLRSFRHSRLAFGGCFTHRSSIEGEFYDLFVRPLIDSHEATAGQMLLAKYLDFGVVEGLVHVHRRILAPTLLVWGTEDPFFPIDKARNMVSQFGGGAELRAIQGASLYCHEDRAAEFLAHVDPFLTRCFERGQG